MSVALAARGLQVTGVDVSAEMLEVAAVKARATKKPRRSGPCVTDNGFGRYENCRSYF